jgi:hypothetical protein
MRKAETGSIEQLAVGILVIIVVGIILLVVVRSRETVVIHVIFPDGFRGTATVMFDRPDGIPLRARSGNYELHIPNSGLLKIQDSNPELRPHRMEATYKSGGALPIGYLTRGDTFPNEVIAVWPLLGKGSNLTLLVGSTQERRNQAQLERERITGSATTTRQED